MSSSRVIVWTARRNLDICTQPCLLSDRVALVFSSLGYTKWLDLWLSDLAPTYQVFGMSFAHENAVYRGE